MISKKILASIFGSLTADITKAVPDRCGPQKRQITQSSKQSCKSFQGARDGLGPVLDRSDSALYPPVTQCHASVCRIYYGCLKMVSFANYN